MPTVRFFHSALVYTHADRQIENTHKNNERCVVTTLNGFSTEDFIYDFFYNILFNSNDLSAFQIFFVGCLFVCLLYEYLSFTNIVWPRLLHFNYLLRLNFESVDHFWHLVWNLCEYVGLKSHFHYVGEWPISESKMCYILTRRCTGVS